MPLAAPLHDFTKTASFFLVHSPDILNIVHCEHPFFPPQVVRQPENIGLMGDRNGLFVYAYSYTFRLRFVTLLLCIKHGC